jgi:hypothetical protein
LLLGDFSAKKTSHPWNPARMKVYKLRMLIFRKTTRVEENITYHNR